MKFEKTEVNGLDIAIRSMRNPMNSWDKSDSWQSDFTDDGKNGFVLGVNDLGLAQRLIKAGSEHSKYLRMVQVWADIDMPRYWWSEFDTYGFNTKSSCSTMHRLLNNPKEITTDLFVTCGEDNDIFDTVVSRLESLRKEYLQTKDARLLVRAKRLLPEGFLQTRTVNTNYAELRNIYFQRRNHRLKEEWIDTFCKWIESDLPYAKELIMLEV